MYSFLLLANILIFIISHCFPRKDYYYCYYCSQQNWIHDQIFIHSIILIPIDYHKNIHYCYLQVAMGYLGKYYIYYYYHVLRYLHLLKHFDMPNYLKNPLNLLILLRFTTTSAHKDQLILQIALYHWKISH